MDINCKHAWVGWIFHTICRLITSVVEFQDLLQWFWDAFSGHKREMPCEIQKNFWQSWRWALDFIVYSTKHTSRTEVLFISENTILWNCLKQEINNFEKFPFSHWSWDLTINLGFFLSWKLKIAWHLTILDFYSKGRSMEYLFKFQLSKRRNLHKIVSIACHFHSESSSLVTVLTSESQCFYM